MKRFDIINYLIEKNGYTNYLEIGVQNRDCFDRIKIKDKTGVDPSPNTKDLNNLVRVTSDNYFKSIDDSTEYDIIFIDGLHTFGQSYDDLENSLYHLKEGGSIVMHDCNPHNEQYAGKDWCGDVWKTIQKIREEQDTLLVYTIDTDHGCAIIQRGDQELITSHGQSYKALNDNRNEILNLVSWVEYINLGKSTAQIISDYGVSYDDLESENIEFENMTTESIKDLYREKFPDRRIGRKSKDTLIKELRE